MSNRIPRRPVPAASSRPIPTLECMAVALAAAGTAGCRNPFDRTVAPPEPQVRADPQPALGVAGMFATHALMTIAPDHGGSMHPAIPGAHAAAAIASATTHPPAAAPATPGGCSVKEGGAYGWGGGGGAYISVRPYGGRHIRYRY